jgi:tRNA U34 5-methylaminomethyl-2-thiouridine-forming methyltransferase MnmC
MRKMIYDCFSIQINHVKVHESHLPDSFFDIVFFDAFSPEVQPEMWSKEVFIKISNSLKSGGCLLTYSCKGMVRRNLSDSGFSVEKLPGPPGKREFVRAKKMLNALQNL